MKTPTIMFRLPAIPAARLWTLFEDCETFSDDLEMVIERVFAHALNPELEPLVASGSLETYRALLVEAEATRANIEREGGAREHKKRLRTARALAGYLSRMSSRCTPFGLMVAVGHAKVGETSDLIMHETPEADEVVAVLSPYLGAELTAQLGGCTADYPDPTSYRVRGRVRRYIHEEGVWQLRECPPGDLAAVVKAPLAATESRSVEEFLARVAAAEECPSDQRDAAAAVLGSVERVNGRVTSAWVKDYETCQTGIETLLSSVNSGLLSADRKASRFVLCTRVCEERLTIGRTLLSKIHRAASVLDGLFHPYRSSSSIAAFARRLDQRAEGKFVPLLTALDPSFGVGYLSSDAGSLEIIDGALGKLLQEPATATTGYVNPKVAELLVSAAKAGQNSISLDDDWIGDGLDSHEFSILGSVASNDRFFLSNVFLGDAFEFAGRFGHDLPGLAEGMRQQVLAKRRERVIDAEIVYIPHGVDANVGRRAAVYGHEIVCSGRAGQGTVGIPANELWVGVEGTHLRLWWNKKKCWVNPRLSCAHNAERCRFPIYRFLADLARSQGGWLSWQWGPFSTLRSLPEVTVGGVQLSPRTWNISRAEFKRLARLPLCQRVSELREIREEHGIPRWVQAGTDDQFVETDLQNPVFLDVAFHKAKEVESLTFRESRMAATAVVGRDGDFYSNEIAVGFPRASPRPHAPPSLPTGRLSTLKFRGFTPGSEWLSLKIYEETPVLETVLVEKLTPWIEDSLRQGVIDKWFFLRYGDPRGHLRLRLHGAPDALIGVVREIHELFDGVEFSVDSYSPEVQRYGGEVGMQICESIFMVDSFVASEIVSCLPLEFAAKRWEMSLGILDGMLTAACVSAAAKAELFAEMAKSYAKIARIDLVKNRQLNASYRTRRTRIEGVVAMAREQSGCHDGYTSSIAELVAREGEIDGPVTEVLKSLIHMHLNRVLGPRQIEQEVVVYDYLRRFYRSEAARLPTSAPPGARVPRAASISGALS